MVEPADKVVLLDSDAELALVGSFVVYPEALAAYAAECAAEWFGEPFVRYMFDACLKVNALGARVSLAALTAALPEDCGGITRGRLVSSAMAAAVPANAVRGLIEVIRDRWARRVLAEAGGALGASATSFGISPFDAAGEAVALLDTVNAAKAGTASAGESIGEAAAALIASHAAPAELAGATTGLIALDKKINGFVRKQFFLLAGRPGMGKSAAGVSLLRRTAQAGHGVAFFSLEMPRIEVAARAIADMLDDTMAPSFGNILRAQFDLMWTPAIADCRVALESYPLIVDDSARLNMAEIAARARRYKARFEAEGRRLAVVAIDHIGLVVPSGRYAGNKVAENGEVSNLCRVLAKELDCCVLGLAQLSREVENREDKRPQLSDLRWTGDLEQDAHVVMFLYRDWYYKSQDQFADPALLQSIRWHLDWLIRKNRNGPVDDVRTWCSIAHSSVRDS